MHKSYGGRHIIIWRPPYNFIWRPPHNQFMWRPPYNFIWRPPHKIIWRPPYNSFKWRPPNKIMWRPPYNLYGGRHLILYGGRHIILYGGRHIILYGGRHIILYGGRHISNIKCFFDIRHLELSAFSDTDSFGQFNRYHVLFWVKEFIEYRKWFINGPFELDWVKLWYW